MAETWNNAPLPGNGRPPGQPDSVSFFARCDPFAPPDLDGGRGNGEFGDGNEDAENVESCDDAATCMNPAVTPTHPRYVDINMTSYWHIFLNHGFYIIDNKSTFYDRFLNVNSINSLISMVFANSIGIMQSHQTVRYTATLPFIVGINRFGDATSVMTVIVRPTGAGRGSVVTAYPGG